MRKKEKKAGKKPAKNKNMQDSEMFNFDNEIVIGVTKIPEPKKSKKEKKKEKQKRKPTPKKVQAKPKKQEKQEQKIKVKPNKKIDLKKEKRKRRAMAFLKGIAITTVVIGILLAILLSPLFKIETIDVTGNSKISKSEIIELSKIEKGKNIFLINSNKTINQIKQSSYIESAKVERQLPDKIVLKIQERQATYALKYDEKYIYINNQGYILEIAETKGNLPEILSYKTNKSQITVGGRLENEDLEMLGIILKIMESANNHGIGNLITSIDIANKNDIILQMDSQRKNSIYRKCIRYKY